MVVDDPINQDRLFGGKPVLFGGDFRQVLPVVEGVARGDIIDASLLESKLWKHVEVMRLTVNMRLSNAELSEEQKVEMKAFAQWTLNVGEGRLTTRKQAGGIDSTWIDIPPELLLTPPGDKVSAIADAVYDHFDVNHALSLYLAQCAVICPVNVIVDEVNDHMLMRVPALSKEYLSYDTITNSAEQPLDFEILYPPEFLNSVVITNFPHHRLCLKVGVPVFLLRNINQPLGLCNGTRLLITRLGDRVLEGEIIMGTNIEDSSQLGFVMR